MKKYILLLFLLALLLSACGSTASPAASSSPEPTPEPIEVIYDVDEIINEYVVLFNRANPDAPIAGTDLSVYHHHGSDHKDQAKLTYKDFDITISSSSYQKGISVVIMANGSKEEDDWKEIFKAFGKPYRSTLTDDILTRYRQQKEEDTIHSGKFEEFNFSSRCYNKIELIEFNGHLG